MQTISEILSAIGTSIQDFLNAILVFLYSLKLLPELIKQLYDAFFGSNEHFFAWIFAKAIELAVLAYFTLMAYLVPFTWDIAHIILADIIAAANLQAYASLIPAPMNAVLNIMGVYKAFDMIITAYIARWIFGFIPFVGR